MERDKASRLTLRDRLTPKEEPKTSPSMSNPLPTRKPLPTRNVFVKSPEAFWQYGFVDWKTFYTWLRTLVFSDESWAIFDGNVVDNRHGQMKVEDTSLVDPGLYVLLRSDGTPLTENYGLPANEPRTRHPTPPGTAKKIAHYKRRTITRDAKCLITGIPIVGRDYLRFEVTHIFPPNGHEFDKKKWNNNGYSDRITDPAPLDEMGGPSKIDSLQNLILIRTDLRIAWDDYMFGVNPDAGYIIIPFINGYDDIAGKTLKLDHISNPNLRPLDDLFRYHFLQGVIKHISGTGEPLWNYTEIFRDGLDLSRIDIWGTEEGKKFLEMVLLRRLRDLETEGELELCE